MDGEQVLWKGWLVYQQLCLLTKFESCHERQKNNHTSLDFLAGHNEEGTLQFCRVSSFAGHFFECFRAHGMDGLGPFYKGVLKFDGKLQFDVKV